MQYKLFFAEKQYSFRYSSVPNSMNLRFLFAIEWELHRVWLGVTRDLHRTCKDLMLVFCGNIWSYWEKCVFLQMIKHINNKTINRYGRKE